MFGPETDAGLPRVQGRSGTRAGKMNPGKLVDADPLDEDLRLGRGLPPRAARRRYFRFPDDEGSFGDALLRCVGVGKCRRESRRHHVPELPGHPRGAALHPRPGAPAVGDAARRDLLTGGWRNEDVKRGARPLPGLQGLQERLPGRTSTWPPTRPSFWPTTTRAGCVPARPTPWG